MAVTRITTQLIKDLAITTAKIAANAVTLGKLGSLSAKGSLITHDGSDHVARAVGTDGFLLTADSAQTSGLNWTDPDTVGSGVQLAKFIFQEVPSGTINGINDTFTLANTPEAGTDRLYLNGVRMHRGATHDYTISGATITFEGGQIPQTDDELFADYIST